MFTAGAQAVHLIGCVRARRERGGGSAAAGTTGTTSSPPCERLDGSDNPVSRSARSTVPSRSDLRRARRSSRPAARRTISTSRAGGTLLDRPPTRTRSRTPTRRSTIVGGRRRSSTSVPTGWPRTARPTSGSGSSRATSARTPTGRSAASTRSATSCCSGRSRTEARTPRSGRSCGIRANATINGTLRDPGVTLATALTRRSRTTDAVRSTTATHRRRGRTSAKSSKIPPSTLPSGASSRAGSTSARSISRAASRASSRRRARLRRSTQR